MQKNGGQLGSFPNFYKDTRFNVKNGKWAAPICESLYNQMRKEEEDQAQLQASQPDTAPAPLTPEEMSVKYLRARSGVVKGIGMRPSSSMQTTATSQGPTPTEEMARLHLEMETERQQRTQIEQQMEVQQRHLEEQQRQLEEQKLQMNQMMSFMQSMGYQNRPPPPPPDDGSAGCGLVAS